MTKSTYCRLFFITAVLPMFFGLETVSAWDPPCDGCCYWNGEECVSGSCPGCCFCLQCSCVPDNTECSGCCDCEACYCVNRNYKCPGCCKCSGCGCVDDDAYCSQSNCYRCNGCYCEYECNPETQKCCDGSCEPKCEEVGSETLCGSEKDISCLACVGILGDCFDYKAKVYSNETIYNCSGGCPGECDDESPAPPCYDEYFCNDYIYYHFARCTIWRYEPSDIPQDPEPLECYGRDYPWGCTRCQQGDYYRTLNVLSRRCQ